MAERDGGGRSEETETEDSTEDLWGSLGGAVDGTEVVLVKLLDAKADCLLRKGILSLVVEVLAPLERG